MGTEFQHRVAGDACREVASNIDHYIQEAELEPLRLEGEQRAFERGAQALGAIIQKAKKDNADGTLSDEAWSAMVPYLRACTGKLMVMAQDVQVAKHRCEGRMLGLRNAKKIVDGHVATHTDNEATARDSESRFGRNNNDGRFGRDKTEVTHAEFDLSGSEDPPAEATLAEETNAEPPPQLLEMPTQDEVEVMETSEPEESPEGISEGQIDVFVKAHSLGRLRNIAREKGLKVGGRKRDLARRILAVG
jgi:hypothetical protein